MACEPYNFQKESSGDFTYTNEFWADGVRPKGLQVLADVLSKAIQELGDSSLSVNNLLK